MSVESGTKIQDLQDHQPEGSDPVSEGDEHLRLIKEVLVKSFPSDIYKQIPEVTDNANKFLQVSDDTLSTQWSEIEFPVNRRRGEYSRATFSFDEGVTTISPAYYDLEESGGVVSWNEDLTITAEGKYIYLNSSAISGKIVDNSGLIASDTPPTWSNLGHGWYDGDNRCIFPSVGDATDFFHAGGEYVQYGEDLEERVYSPITPNTWISESIDRNPIIINEVELTFQLKSQEGSTASCAWKFLTKQNGTSGHSLGVTEAGSGNYDDEHITANRRIFLDNQSILVRGDTASGLHSMTIFSNGFYLPQGL